MFEDRSSFTHTGNQKEGAVGLLKAVLGPNEVAIRHNQILRRPTAQTPGEIIKEIKLLPN